MYSKILIATDGTELAGKAVTQGLALAKQVGAEVAIVTVTEMWSVLEMAYQAQADVSRPIERYETAEAEHAARILEPAAKKAAAAGVACTTTHVSDMHPAEGILEAAGKAGSDLIVMASHGRRGLERVLLGSQALEVLTHSKIPVLVVR